MPVNFRFAELSWEGDSRKVLKEWPKSITADFGAALYEMQQGKPSTLSVRPMTTIGAGVYELKDSDDKTWYRVIYLARVKDKIYILHCFKKSTNKTPIRDLATAEQRMKHVLQRLREEKRNAQQQ